MKISTWLVGGVFGGVRDVSRRTSQSRRVLLAISGLVLASSSGWAQVSQSGNVSPLQESGPLPNPWRTFGPLVIGVNGVGNVGVSENGSVIVSGSTTLGHLLGSDGTLSVGGEGSSAITGNLFVGREGKGYMVISEKGYVYGGPLGGSSVIGVAATGEGTVLVDGEGALWGAGPLTVGHEGDGFLTIQNKGKVSSSESYIGMFDGSESIATVTGAGTEWNASGMYPESGGISVGYSGKGTLLVSSGAKVTSGTGTVGHTSGLGLATITGTDSLWSINTDLRIGYNSGKDNKLNIESGGRVTNSVGMIAGSTNGTRGTVTVKGTNSTWASTATLSVGEYGNGYLNVENGGQVSNTIGYLGNINQSRGEAIVTGAGSVWTNADALFVGNGGRGILQVRDGGRVVADFVGLGMTGAANGSIQLDGTTDHRGVLETHYLAEGESNAGGTITFNGGILRARGNEANFLRGFETDDVVIDEGGAFIDTQAFAIGIATNLTGTGGLTKLGSGSLALSGVNTYSGPTTIAAGTLVNNGSLASDIVVASGSTLKGAGTYDGVVTIEEGGSLAPGNSPGTVTFQGGLTLEKDVILSLELGAAASDLIVVSGGDLLGPTSGTILLQIVDAGDFAAGLYTLIDATGANLIDLTIEQFTLSAAPGGYEYELLRTGDLYQLQVDAVPEPSTVALLLGSLVIAALFPRLRLTPARPSGQARLPRGRR